MATITELRAALTLYFDKVKSKIKPTILRGSATLVPNTRSAILATGNYTLPDVTGLITDIYVEIHGVAGVTMTLNPFAGNTAPLYSNGSVVNSPSVTGTVFLVYDKQNNRWVY